MGVQNRPRLSASTLGDSFRPVWASSDVRPHGRLAVVMSRRQRKRLDAFEVIQNDPTEYST